jgi:hypothetical protein
LTADRRRPGWLFWLIVTLVVVIALVYLASTSLTGGPA